MTLDYFGLLGVSPALGRVWTAEEPDAIVVSSAFWRDKLGRDPGAVGSSIIVEGRPRVVVGIMPLDFMPPYFQATDAWAPIDMPTLLADLRGRRTLTVLARRAPGRTPQDVDAYLTLFSTQLQERLPEHRGQVWVARSLRDELVGSSRPALIGTAAAAALLLLIVAASIAGLSTAETIAARHQLVVRAALGATRGRLFAEHLVESVVLAVVGSMAGIWIASGLVAIVDGYQQFFLPRLMPITLDNGSVAIAVAAGVVIGLAAITTRVVVINETMARMFWPQGNAIGTEVQIGAGSPNDRWITIVGIMADMRAHGLTETIRPTAFGTTLQYHLAAPAPGRAHRWVQFDAGHGNAFGHSSG